MLLLPNRQLATSLNEPSDFNVDPRCREKKRMLKPQNLGEYQAWSRATLGSDFEDPRILRLYETNISNIFNAIAQHPFFIGFSHEAAQWEIEYTRATGSDLFMTRNDPQLITKPFSSVVEKTYRQNVVMNRAFPREPRRGWLTDRSLFALMNDLIRGTLVCRFIDGPAFVAERIQKYADTHGLPCRQYSQERDDGYYAYHVYVKMPARIFDLNWNQEDIHAEVELQITTQLQEVLRALTHKFYETRRLNPDEQSGKWKWEFATNRFKVGYLSHTLHLLESIILESRNSVLGTQLTDEKEESDDA
jgi:ppGpp synthetase/RelA/SpoT-type nucleotidyltranferase